MQYYTYVVIDKQFITSDTFVIKIRPKNAEAVFPYQAGQYCHLLYAAFDPDEAHPFSIASSPENTEYLEFCIKMVGDWTTRFSEVEVGEAVRVSEPQGQLVWSEALEKSVFLVGGVGISPVMSMLRHIQSQGQQGDYTLLYGSRTPENITYKEELTTLEKDIDALKVVHVLSDINEETGWSGYTGFITPEIVQKEVPVKEAEAFYIVGPPIFQDKMKQMLSEFGVPASAIRQEIH